VQSLTATQTMAVASVGEWSATAVGDTVEVVNPRRQVARVGHVWHEQGRAACSTGGVRPDRRMPDREHCQNTIEKKEERC
jgi:hypothetical protein